jgi:hypothetical protein
MMGKEEKGRKGSEMTKERERKERKGSGKGVKKGVRDD